MSKETTEGPGHAGLSDWKMYNRLGQVSLEIFMLIFKKYLFLLKFQINGAILLVV